MSFDFDLFVIGAGSGGIRAARFSAEFGARVAIAEENDLGGTCVNVGCIPKKILSYSAQYPDKFLHCDGFGWSIDSYKFDFHKLIQNKNKEIRRLNDLYRTLIRNSGAILYEGHASLVDSNTVQIGKKKFSARHILIATGSWPFVPNIPGAEYSITSNEVFFLERLPKSILIVGGGYIAVELASIFNNLNVKTSLVYRGALFLRGFDKNVREHLRDEFLKKNLKLHLNANVISIEKTSNQTYSVFLTNGERLSTDCVLFATGRRPMLDGINLENTRVNVDSNGFIKVDYNNQTSDPNISAIGDITGKSRLTPTALAEGMAVAKRLFKPDIYRPVDHSFTPSAVFSLPNVATVGLTEEEAYSKNYNVTIFKSSFKPLQFSLTNNLEKTFIKMIVDKVTDRVLGCHMVGPSAAEIMQGIAIALKSGATKQLFDQTIGIHPTLAEEFVSLRKSSIET